MAPPGSPDPSYQYLIRRIEEILDAHPACLSPDGILMAGCCIYGDFETLVNDYYQAAELAQKPRKARPIKGPVLVA